VRGMVVVYTIEFLEEFIIERKEKVALS